MDSFNYHSKENVSDAEASNRSYLRATRIPIQLMMVIERRLLDTAVDLGFNVHSVSGLSRPIDLSRYSDFINEKQMR